MAYRIRGDCGGNKRTETTRERPSPTPPPSQPLPPHPPLLRPPRPPGWVPPALTSWQTAAAQTQPQPTGLPTPPRAETFPEVQKLELGAAYHQWVVHIDSAINHTQCYVCGTATELIQRAQVHLEMTTNYKRLHVPPPGVQATPPTRMNFSKMYDNTNHPFRLPGWPDLINPYTQEGRAGMRQVLWISIPPELQRSGPYA